MELTIAKNSQANIFSSERTKLFRKNEFIYKEKDKVSDIFIILDGAVESKTSNDIKDSQLTLHKGSSLGLIDAILDRPYSRNMKAKSSVSVAVIEKKMIKNLLASNSFSGALIKSLVIDIDNKYPNTWS